MNILFQWFQGNISIIAIIVSLISLVLSIVGIVRSSTSKTWYRLKKLGAIRYGIFHAIVFFCLTCYVLINWEECISMQFFSQFNGDNILFLVWIVDILLFFYDVETKVGKLRKRNIEEATQQIKEKDYERQLKQREEDVNRELSQISTETNGGDEK